MVVDRWSPKLKRTGWLKQRARMFEVEESEIRLAGSFEQGETIVETVKNALLLYVCKFALQVVIAALIAFSSTELRHR